MSEGIGEIIVRDAVKGEAMEIARLIVMAWPLGDFLARCPGLTEEGFIRMISGFVEAEDTIYSYTRTIVATVKDSSGKETAVAAINGYDGAMYTQLKKPVTDTFSRLFPYSPSDFSSVTETEAGEFYLDSVGVDPSMRSRGIGSMLFDAMEKRAREAGFKVVGLIVDEDKPKAEALYLRLGYRLAGYRDFFGHRMKHLQKSI